MIPTSENNVVMLGPLADLGPLSSVFDRVRCECSRYLVFQREA